MLMECYRYRDLVVELVRRELIGDNSGRFTFLWNFIFPLVQLSIYYVIFGVLVGKLGGSGFKGDLFLKVSSGYCIWLLISEVVSKSTSLLQQNRELLKQISFPVSVLPCKIVCFSMILHFTFLVALFFYQVYAVGSVSQELLLIPFLIFVNFFAVCGLSMVVSVMSVVAPQSREFIKLYLMVGIYLTPCLLDISLFGNILNFIYANPMTYFVLVHQSVWVDGYFASMEIWLAWAFISFSLYLIGLSLMSKARTISVDSY